MTRSMTGFGKASRHLNGDTVSVEVNSVNHRFLDCCLHLPPAWSSLESSIKETTRQYVERGRINVWISRKRGSGASHPVHCDIDLAKQYVNAARELGHLLGSMDSLSLDVLAQLDGVFIQEDVEEDLDQVFTSINEALAEALIAMNRMRDTEGAALDVELRQRIGIVREILEVIETRLPQLEAIHRERLRTRLVDLNADAGVTEERLAVELALLAEKGDVTEETVRLRAHLDHAIELLERPQSAGREINFLIQELQREANTLGSKVRDTEVSREILRMKTELEKFREQTQNIE